MERPDLRARQDARTAVFQAMGATPHAYAANLRKLYVERPDLRWEIIRDVLTARSGANIVARAGHIIARHVYDCPGDFASIAWKKLGGMQRCQIDYDVGLAIYMLKEELCLN